MSHLILAIACTVPTTPTQAGRDYLQARYVEQVGWEEFLCEAGSMASPSPEVVSPDLLVMDIETSEHGFELHWQESPRSDRLFSIDIRRSETGWCVQRDSRQEREAAVAAHGRFTDAVRVGLTGVKILLSEDEPELAAQTLEYWEREINVAEERANRHNIDFDFARLRARAKTVRSLVEAP